MDNRVEWQDRLQAYAQDRLSPQDASALENEIAASEDLKNELEYYRMLQLRERAKSLLQAKAQLESVIADTPIEANYGQYRHYFQRHSWLSHRLSILLGTAVLLIATWWGVHQYQQYTRLRFVQTLYKEYLTPLDNHIGFAPNDASNAAIALRAYTQGNYRSAVQYLQTEVATNPDDQSLRLYLSVSALLIEQDSIAAQHLQHLVRENDPLTAVPAKWYLALNLLHRGEEEGASALLNTIQNDAIFGQPAKELLEKLR